MHVRLLMCVYIIKSHQDKIPKVTIIQLAPKHCAVLIKHRTMTMLWGNYGLLSTLYNISLTTRHTVIKLMNQSPEICGKLSANRRRCATVEDSV